MSGVPTARISREVDGERVEGVTRPVFIRNGQDYFLTDLEIYADGNEYPAAVVIDSVSYATVVHAYWAHAAADPEAAERIRAADHPRDAEKLAEQAAIRADWPAIRIAIMARLLRAKFAQHPHLAETLLATGDGRIEYTSFGSDYWNASRGQGRNWMGRLLELVRSEIAAQRAADPPPGR